MLKKCAIHPLRAWKRVQLTSTILRNHTEVSVSVSEASMQTFYKRKLPETLTPFSSYEGKVIFKEALETGTMESYFPLAEQFLTQAEPATCASTTLVMILNALQVDPKRVWKGIWRWFSEQNLNCLPAEHAKEGMSLEQFGPLASCNGASVQTFFYPPNDYDSISHFTNIKPPKETPHFEKWSCKTCETHAKCPSDICIQFTTRYATYETFKSCLVASSRRSDFYLAVNSSRKYMGQTGDGHFSPIAGVHLGQDLGLILDTARFKYPSYWCDLKKLYNSMKDKDSKSEKVRGFALISRNKRDTQLGPLSISVGPDFISMSAVCEDFQSHFVQRVTSKFSNLDDLAKLTSNSQREQHLIYCMLTSLPKEIEYLLAYYLFDFSVRVNTLELKDLHTGEALGSPLYNILQQQLETTELYGFVKTLLESEFHDLSKHSIFTLTCDFVPELFQHVIVLLLASLPRELFRELNSKMTLDLLNKLEIASHDKINKEITALKEIIGNSA